MTTTNNPTIPVGSIEPSPPSRVWTHRMIAVGAAAIVAVVAPVAVLQISGNDATQPAPRTVHVVDAQAVTRDLVNQGLIPRQALEPAPQSTEEKLRILVNQGLIPRQALQPAPQSTEEKLRILVNQGLIPRQALDD